MQSTYYDKQDCREISEKDSVSRSDDVFNFSKILIRKGSDLRFATMQAFELKMNALSALFEKKMSTRRHFTQSFE
jgi:hypothetical protein